MIDLFKSEKRSLIIISVYYAISQCLILIVTGMWGDDWCLINLSNSGLYSWAMEMGKPDVYYIVKAIMGAPEVFYKIIIFLCYYVVTICFWGICKSLFSLSSGDALVLALVYLSIPINDIRIERLTIPYALGLSLWFTAFFLFVYKYTSLHFFLFRFLILILFFFSFILNSMLVFYGFVWLTMLILERLNPKAIIKKFDFIFLPFMFYILKNHFYPAHGSYQGYNNVSMFSILAGMPLTILKAKVVVKEVVNSYFSIIFEHSAFAFALVFIIVLIGIISSARGLSDQSVCPSALRNVLFEFWAGVLAILAGLYPYVVVNSVITTKGFNGRNCILVPFGLSLVFDSGLKLLCKKNGRLFICLLLMVSGAIYYSTAYSEYQASNYWDRGLQECLKLNTQVGQAKTVVIVREGKTYDEINNSLYKMNGLFEEVYGNENRLVVNDYNTRIITDRVFTQEDTKYEVYNMMGFDTDYNNIDVILVYENDIDAREAIKLRVQQLLGMSIDSCIVDHSSLQVIWPNNDEFSYYLSEIMGA